MELLQFLHNGCIVQRGIIVFYCSGNIFVLAGIRHFQENSIREFVPLVPSYRIVNKNAFAGTARWLSTPIFATHGHKRFALGIWKSAYNAVIQLTRSASRCSSPARKIMTFPSSPMKNAFSVRFNVSGNMRMPFLMLFGDRNLKKRCQVLHWHIIVSNLKSTTYPMNQIPWISSGEGSYSPTRTNMPRSLHTEKVYW